MGVLGQGVLRLADRDPRPGICHAGKGCGGAIEPRVAAPITTGREALDPRTEPHAHHLYGQGLELLVA